MSSQVASYLASWAVVDITPLSPVPLAGYGGRDSAYTSVQSPLEANAILLCLDRRSVLLVSLDLLYAGPEINQHIQDLTNQYGAGLTDVFVTTSHTHFAPATDPSKPILGLVDDRYMVHLCRQLAELVHRTYAGPRVEVRLEVSSGLTDLNVNRRRRYLGPTLTRQGLRVLGSMVTAPAPDQPCDNRIDLIRLVAGDGRPVAALWKFACHPVGFPESLAVSAEFPGVVRERLRNVVADSTLPVVFWQGFSGDVRPWIRHARDKRPILTAMRLGPAFGKASLDQWKAWCTQLADEVHQIWRGGAGTSVAPNLDASLFEIPLVSLIHAKDPSRLGARKLTGGQLLLGDSIEVLFMSAEPCTPWTRLGRSGRLTIHVGCLGDVFGYLPTEEQVREGGYEGGVFMPHFGLPGPMKPGFEAIVQTAYDATGTPGAASLT